MRKGRERWNCPFIAGPMQGVPFGASVPSLGGLLTFSLSLMAVGIVVYAGAVPSLAEQSPLARRWASLKRLLRRLWACYGGRSRRREWPRAQRAPHRTIRLRQLMRAHCPTLGSSAAGRTRVAIGGSGLLSTSTGAGASLELAHVDPRAIILARTRPAQVHERRRRRFFVSSSGGSSKCCCADTERTGARPEPTILRPEARFPEIWSRICSTLRSEHDAQGGGRECTNAPTITSFASRPQSRIFRAC